MGAEQVRDAWSNEEETETARREGVRAASSRPAPPTRARAKLGTERQERVGGPGQGAPCRF